MHGEKIGNSRGSTIPANAQAAVKLFQGHARLYFEGWTQQNVTKLLVDLRGILNNFHRLTRNRFPLELLVGLQAGESDRSIVELDLVQQEIHVFLQTGPRLVLDLAPLILSDALYQLMTNGNSGRPAPVVFFSGETEGMVTEASAAIANSYRRERKLDLDEKSLRQTLEATTRAYGGNLTRLKTMYQTLCGPCLPREHVARTFLETIEQTRLKLTSVVVDYDLRHVITTIGQLAMIHTVAKRNGLAEVAQAAYRLLTEEAGDHLVMIELLQMRGNLEGDAPLPPWLIELQRRTGKPSYSEIFNRLVRIFEHQYDSFEIVTGF